jgi:hypothetical protein
MPANTMSILKSMVQGVISTLKPYYLINTFRKAIAAIDSESFDVSVQINFFVVFVVFVSLVFFCCCICCSCCIVSVFTVVFALYSLL